MNRLNGLRPNKISKLKQRNAILLVKPNYGLFIGDSISVIPMLRSWETIGKLRGLDPEGKIVRQGDIINVPKGNFAGSWRIKSIKETNRGIQLDLATSDGTTSRKIGVSVSSLVKSNFTISNRALV